MSWLIYKHTNLINGKVYIGQTKQIPNNRWKNGAGYTRDNRLSVFAAAIKKYGWNNFAHEIIESDIESQEHANVRETYWIKYYNSYIGYEKSNGYNMTLGGDSAEHLGYPVYQIDKDTMQIVNEFPSTSEASRFFGNGEGNASQIRNCCDGKKVSCKGFFWCYKKNYTLNWKPKDNALFSPVYQLNDDFEIIKRYESITEAAIINNFSKGSINSCCQRRQQKANNYYWCYESDYSINWKPTEVSFKRNEKIYCFETDTIYKSAIEASKQTGANYSHIRNVCKGKGNAVNGLHFCYAKDKSNYVIKSNKDESPVVCVNTGRHYKTIVEASKDTGCNQSSISACCRGELKTTRGLTWCYENDYTEGMEIKKGKEKKVICIETGVIYKSTSDASRALNISHGNMSDALKEHSPANNLHFAYYDTYDPKKWRPRKNNRKREIMCIETKVKYESLVAAERSTGITNCNILRAIKSGGTAGGYHWKYASE